MSHNLYFLIKNEEIYEQKLSVQFDIKAFLISLYSHHIYYQNPQFEENGAI